MKKYFPPLFVTLSLCLLSCSSQINGTLYAGGSADLTLRASLEPRMAALLRSFSVVSGAQNETVLDGPAIGRSLAASPGIRSVSFRNSGPAAIEGSIAVSRVDEFLSGGRFRFIRYEQGASGGTLSISLDRNSGPQLISLISGEVAEYLSALMAPAATGIALSREEYLEAVASLYTRGVADEIRTAAVAAVLDFPGPVAGVRGGVFSGSRVRFEVPLLDLLVLESPLYYEVTWR
ncbi:MAG: hypothetical protein LBP32_04800 [Spirochaetaceae bacterium]|jgi:hypothetical protein|nr:hypothetical protein [Spirochaetaceae bacterium]